MRSALPTQTQESCKPFGKQVQLVDESCGLGGLGGSGLGGYGLDRNGPRGSASGFSEGWECYRNDYEPSIRQNGW